MAPPLASSPRRPGMGLFTADLNSELKSRLKKSSHATVGNLNKSASNIEQIMSTKRLMATAEQSKPSDISPAEATQSVANSGSSSDTEEGKDLGKLLRSVSKENMNSVSKALVNISKRLSGLNKDDEIKATSTSEGESSGGREVKTIIKNSAVARRKKQTDGWVYRQINVIQAKHSHFQFSQPYIETPNLTHT